MADPRDFDILHEDAHLLYVNKPAKMLATPVPEAESKGPSLFERLQEAGRKLIPVHRLDYETTGVIVFAKDAGTAAALVDLFKNRHVKKVYQAIVHGWPEPVQGTIELKIRDKGAEAAISNRGEEAVTHYSTLRRIGPCALLRVEIETGRHNQIRLHFAHKGHPLIGERKYARGSDFIVRHGRVLLHSASIAFQPPHLSHVLKIAAPLAEDFEEALVRIAEVETRKAPASIAPLFPAERGGRSRAAGPRSKASAASRPSDRGKKGRRGPERHGSGGSKRRGKA
jgi:RluA family pseudouridine synthase